MSSHINHLKVLNDSFDPFNTAKRSLMGIFNYFKAYIDYFFPNRSEGLLWDFFNSILPVVFLISKSLVEDGRKVSFFLVVFLISKSWGALPFFLSYFFQIRTLFRCIFGIQKQISCFCGILFKYAS